MNNKTHQVVALSTQSELRHWPVWELQHNNRQLRVLTYRHVLHISPEHENLYVHAIASQKWVLVSIQLRLERMFGTCSPILQRLTIDEYGLIESLPKESCETLFHSCRPESSTREIGRSASKLRERTRLYINIYLYSRLDIMHQLLLRRANS